jgi:exopolyphosphatase / guanosine-5'-triphosphate,3'-diphosphate pyrophosphatase
VDKIVPRWEWRTFGTDFGEADARFAVMDPEMTQESDEIYLVSSVIDKAVKLRAGLMDIKSLERVSDAGLEQWRPVLKVEVPLSPENAERVCAALGAAPPATRRDSYTLEQLVEELRESQPDLRTAPLHKKRLHYTVGGCMAEMTEVLVEGKVSRTLALESEDPDRVVAAMRDLKLTGRENTSYPRWLGASAGLGS